MASGVVLLAVNWLIAFIAFHIDWFGPIVKGNPILLIKDGQVQERVLRRADLSEHDLEQHIQLQAQETDLNNVKLAYLKRNGNTSVIPANQEPRVFVVPVEDGVQTVRIEIK